MISRQTQGDFFPIAPKLSPLTWERKESSGLLSKARAGCPETTPTTTIPPAPHLPAGLQQAFLSAC